MFLILALAAYTEAVEAIVIRDDRPDAEYLALAAGLPKCSLDLGGWGGGCTLIHPQWALEKNAH